MDRMTQKERLVELLKDFDKPNDDEWDEEELEFYRDEEAVEELERLYGELADFFLSNGVIVPPCKVGDTVYDIGVFSKVMKAEVATVMTDGSEFLSAVVIPRKPHHRWLVNWKNAGKTVFLTRKEAEKALKERKRNDGF